MEHAEALAALDLNHRWPLLVYRIEGGPRDDVPSLETWEVYQYSNGDEYEISGGVASESEALTVVAHFQSHGSPGVNTEEFERAYADLDAVLDRHREGGR